MEPGGFGYILLYHTKRGHMRALSCLPGSHRILQPVSSRLSLMPVSFMSLATKRAQKKIQPKSITENASASSMLLNSILPALPVTRRSVFINWSYFTTAFPNFQLIFTVFFNLLSDLFVFHNFRLCFLCRLHISHTVPPMLQRPYTFRAAAQNTYRR